MAHLALHLSCLDTPLAFNIYRKLPVPAWKRGTSDLETHLTEYYDLLTVRLGSFVKSEIISILILCEISMQRPLVKSISQVKCGMKGLLTALGESLPR